VTLAGYTQNIVDSVINYITDGTATAEREASLLPSLEQQSQSQGTMSSSSAFKRPRTSSTPGVPVSKVVKKYVQKCVKRMIEKKYATAVIDQANVGAAGSILSLGCAAITQGTSDSTRTGNIIRVVKLMVRFQVTSVVTSLFRYLIVWDKQSNGTLPGVAEVLLNANVNGMYNPDTVVGHGGKRFTIVKDSLIPINPSITAANQIYYRTHTFIKSMGRPVVYDASTGAATDLVSNNLFILYLDTSGTSDVVGYSEIEFEDA